MGEAGDPKSRQAHWHTRQHQHQQPATVNAKQVNVASMRKEVAWNTVSGVCVCVLVVVVVVVVVVGVCVCVCGGGGRGSTNLKSAQRTLTMLCSGPGSGYSSSTCYSRRAMMMMMMCVCVYVRVCVCVVWCGVVWCVCVGGGGVRRPHAGRAACGYAIWQPAARKTLHVQANTRQQLHSLPPDA